MVAAVVLSDPDTSGGTGKAGGFWSEVSQKFCEDPVVFYGSVSEFLLFLMAQQKGHLKFLLQFAKK